MPGNPRESMSAQLETAVRASELQYRSLAELSPDGVLVHTDGEIVFANSSMVRLLGVKSAEELIGRQGIEFAAPEERQRILHDRERASTGETGFSGEFRHLRLDGSEIYLERAMSHLEWDGKPSFLAVFQDNTEKRNVEKALRESEQRYRTILDSMVDTYYRTDMNGRIDLVSRSATDLLGYSTEELIGHELADLYIENDGREKFLREMERTGGKVSDYEAALRHKDGQEVWVSTNAHYYRDVDGNVIGVEGTTRNITDRREKELTSRRLATIQERFLAAIDNLNDQVALYDSELRLVNFNNAFCADFEEASNPLVLGMTLDDVLRTRMRHGRIPEGAKGKEEEWIAARIQRFHNPTGPWEFERDGKVFETREEKLPNGETMVIVSNITARKRTEIALRESEEHYREVIENAPYAIIVIQRDGIILFANQTAVELFLADSIDQFIGIDNLDLMHPDHHEEVESRRQQVLSGRARHFVERRRIRFDGTEFMSETSATQCMWNGEPAVLIGIHDISDRVEADEKLRESEQRFKDIAETVSDRFWEMDEDFRFTLITPASGSMLNINPGRVLSRTRWEVVGIDPDKDSKWRQHRKDHLAHSSFSGFEYEIADEDGHIHNLSVNGRPVFDEKGIFKGYRGSATDVTDVKRAELELRDSEAQMRLITDNIPVRVAYIDRSFVVRFANRPYAEWQGLSQKEIIGRHLRDVRGKEWYELFVPFAEKNLAGEMTSHEGERILEDGNRVYFNAINVPHFADDGSIVGFFVLIVDLTEHHEREAQLRQAQKMEAVGQLTGGIAHEFNNLLMVVVGNLEMSMDRISDTPARKFASASMDAAMRGAELTRQLLAFSRKQHLRVEPIDLSILVDNMREMLQRTLGETVSVDVELINNIWPILADRSLLESALLNLSLNARDAMPKGGRIVISTSNRSVDAQLLARYPEVTPGDYIMLEVADNGSGIAPENLEHVFEPFFTTKDVGEGTGLGLSMILGFAEQSGGFVDIESQLDQGTKVRVYLPRSMEIAAALEREESIDAEVSSVTATVLVVEDDPDVREIVVGILSELGCKTIEAKDGKAAFSALAEHQNIDVLFTDVVLPEGISGPDIAGEARSMRPKLKIVFTSGYPDGEVNDLGYDDDKPWFIRKPYRKSELAALFNDVLQS